MFFDYPNEPHTTEIVFFFLYVFQMYFIACSYIISAIISFMLYYVITAQVVIKIDDYKTSLLLLVFGTNFLWLVNSVIAYGASGLLEAYRIAFYSYYVVLAAVAFNVIAYIGCVAKVRKMQLAKLEQYHAIIALISRYKWYPIIQVFGR